MIFQRKYGKLYTIIIYIYDVLKNYYKLYTLIYIYIYIMSQSIIVYYSIFHHNYYNTCQHINRFIICRRSSVHRICVGTSRFSRGVGDITW